MDLVTGRKREREREMEHMDRMHNFEMEHMDRMHNFAEIKGHFDSLKKENETLTKKLLTQKAAMAGIASYNSEIILKEEMLKELRTTVKRID